MTLRIAAFALVFLFGGCATVPAPQPLPALAGVPAAFEMSGRLAVRQGERSEIARLRWTRRPAGDEWVFASPLGNEVARIRSDSRGAVLEQAGGAPEAAASFAELTGRVIGVALEPAQLSDWLHGRSAEASAPADWKVQVDETHEAGTVKLARRITASRGDVVVRLVVDAYRALTE